MMKQGREAAKTLFKIVSGRVAAGLLAASLALSSSAFAAPAINLLTAPMVTPASAWAYYGSSTTHTADPAWAVVTPIIAAEARALGAGRTGVSAVQYSQNVFDYVRNNIITEFRFGLGKGGRGALIDQSGTPFDQAQLMVQLLAQGGVTASYQVGSITLTAQQFGLWTGLVTNLNASAQTFSVSAQAACQFLADGGIPAIINGVVDNGTQSYCNQQVSGTLTSITLTHIWVSANGNLYDPSFKQNVLKSGIDLAAAIGCGSQGAATCGSLAQSAMLSGATQGTLGSTSAPYAQHLNENGVLTQIAGFATSLQANLISSHPNAVLSDILGGAVSNLAYAPVAGPSLPYTGSAQTTWTGDIPDQFRTSVTLQFCGQTLTTFGDVYAGRRVRQWVTAFPIGPYGNVAPQSTLTTISIYIDDQDVMDCSSSPGTPITNPVALSVAPPYAATIVAGSNTSRYGFTSIDTGTPIQPSPPYNLVVQLGEASESTSSYYGDLMKGDPSAFHAANNVNTCSTNLGVPSGCSSDFSLSAAQLMAAQSHGAAIAGAVSGAAIRHHVRIGFVPATVTAGVSAESYAGDAPTAAAAFELSTHMSSALEGGLQGVAEPSSGSTLFALSNRMGSQIIDITPSNMSAVIPYLSNYGSRTSGLQALANAGYESIIPQNAQFLDSMYLGFTGTPMVQTGLLSSDYEIQSNSSGQPISVGLLIGESYKGTAAPDLDPAGDILATVYRKTETKTAISQGEAVDRASGQLKLSPSPDIVTGVGSFPSSLPLTRTYMSNGGVYEHVDTVYTYATSIYPIWTYEGPDSGNMDHLGGGWVHNYQVTASWSSDAPMALGQNRAVDASAVIAAAFTNSLLLRSPTFISRLTALFSDYWMAKQFLGNAVFVRIGGQSTEFTLLPNHTFLPPLGSAATLTMAGGGALNPANGNVAYTYIKTQSQLPCIDLYTDYAPFTFTLTNAGGDKITFDNSQYSQGPVPGCTASVTIGSPVFKADNWTFPSGINVKFNYNVITTPRSTTYDILSSVSNSLGRSLTFSDTLVSYENEPASASGGYANVYPTYVGWVINSVTDENQRTVKYAVSNCPTFYANYGTSSTSSAVGTAAWACNTFTTTLPDGTVWTYDYTPGSYSPDPSLIIRPPYRLRRVFEPTFPTTAMSIVAYDGLYRTATVTDILNHVGSYYPSALFATELWKRTDFSDALGNVDSQWFDQWNSLLSSTDPLGRTTTFVYDSARRKILETLPLGNSAAYAYDVRSNLLSTTTSPAPGSSLAAMVTSTTYNEAASVFPCADPVTCNEPATSTDALGNVTTYSWNSSTGQITQVVKPADVNGNQPQTTFTYTGYTGTDGNSISLLTGASEKASSSVSLNQAFAYSPASQHLALSSVTIDPSGLSLTTSVSFTPEGDLAGLDDPRGNCVGYGYDAMRRKTAEGYYTVCGGPWLKYSAFYYDADSELITEYRATGFDANNNATGWQTWQTTYTPTHKVKTKVDPLNDTTTYAYDSLDRPSTVTDPTGYVTQYVYDAASQKLQEQRAVGTPIQENYATYTYSLNGKVLSEADARGNAITYAYDGFDRLSTTTYADGTTEQNAYDPKSEITIWTNRAGLSQIRCFDALGRKISEKSVTGATNTGSCPTGGTENLAADWWDFYDRSFSYDLADRMLSANSTAGWNRTYTYDAAGRPLTLVDGFGTFTYGHDASGNLVSLSYPTGHVVSYAYDALDRLTNATLDGNTVATLTWNALSLRTALTYGDGSSVSYGYDAADRMSSLAHVFPNGTSANVSFGFGYDAAGRLTSETSGNGAYDYVPSASSQTYATANTLNQYPSVNGAARSYWAAGQLFMDSQLSHYYDQAGMLTYVGTVASAGAEALYAPSDAFGRVFARYHNTPYATPGYPSGVDSILFYSYGPERPETVVDRTYTAPYNASNYTWVGDRAYVLGPAPDERLAFEDINGTVYYPHTDRQGSTIALSTAGADVLTLTYDAYGQPSQTINDLAPGASSYPYLYTGQRYDPTLQAYDYKARIYSAVDGRFWQTDPIGPKDDINLYAYTHNDPLDGTDPDGEADVVVTGNPCASGWTCIRGAEAIGAFLRGIAVPGLLRIAAPPLAFATALLLPTNQPTGEDEAMERIRAAQDADDDDASDDDGGPNASQAKSYDDKGAGRKGGARAGGKPHKGKSQSTGSRKRTNDKHTKTRSGSKTKQRDSDDWRQR